MKKINKYLRNSQYISCVVTALFVLMIFLFYFSQMMMETSAYSFMLSKTCTTKKVAGIQKLIEYKEWKSHEEKKQKKKKQKKEKKIDSKESTGLTSENKVLMKPVKEGITTSVFGDTLERNATHLGHDWAVVTGTNVYAAADGTVEKAYLSTSYGYNILVQHQNGLKTRYAHLSEMLVEKGMTVTKGQVIGYSGDTGDSTGPHLHFEVIQMEKHVNPLLFLED